MLNFKWWEMKVLVLGKNGMLGHIVYEYLEKQGYDIVGTTRSEYDAEKDDIKPIIEKIKPNVVINCIGILNKACEENKPLAIKINSYLPHYLDKLSEEYGYYLIHISTDCVFDGIKGNYDEKSYPNAISFYGRTKALGEVINDRNVTLRTSIVGYDNNPNGIGLFQWFMKQQGEVQGYRRVMWTGVTTIELAKQIKVAIENHLTGLQHVVNNNVVSKENLLKLIKKYFKKNIEIKPNYMIRSDKTLRRTELSYNFDIPSYEDMIKEMSEWK